MRIYVAAPLSGTEYERACNVTRAVDAGIRLIQLGHSPFVPHLSHWLDLRQAELEAGLEYEDYMRVDLEWLQASDALLFLGHSPGADRELAKARQLKKVIYDTIEEVPDHSWMYKPIEAKT